MPRLLMDGDVVFDHEVITFVGLRYDGPADTLIDGRDLMVMPELVDIHSHPSTEPFYRGVREEYGVSTMFVSGFMNARKRSGPIWRRKAGTQVAYCEMLLSASPVSPGRVAGQDSVRSAP